MSDSNPGQGITVPVSLPVSDGENASASASVLSTSNPTRRQISHRNTMLRRRSRVESENTDLDTEPVVVGNTPRQRRSRAVGASSSTSALSGSAQAHCQTSYRNSMLRRNRIFRPQHADLNPDAGVVAVTDLTSPFYIDFGDCSQVCEFCGALFWFEERLTSYPLSVRPRYNRCCRAGRVELAYPSEPPQLLVNLFANPDLMSNIRAYNAMFSMTSFGAKVDDEINNGIGPYVFKVAGQVSHWLGSVCPLPGDAPRFLQMYVFDEENEIANRLRFFQSLESQSTSFDVVASLTQMLNKMNEYVQLFRMAKDLCAHSKIPNFYIRLYSRASDRRYDVPTGNCVGAILCEADQVSSQFDVIIRSKDGTPHRVSKLHSSYMPLQYPLLFPRAEQGWSPELRLKPSVIRIDDVDDSIPVDTDIPETSTSATSSDDSKLTPIMFYSYQIHDRENLYTHLLKASRLLQQYMVDAYICVEHCRLEYYRQHQDEFRCEFLQGIHDAISRGDTEANSIGKRVILPASFTGGPRYMYKHYQDALAICRVHGNPQYFITFTCNVRWPEITRHLNKVGVSNPQDRPDIIARVFQHKVRAFIKHLRKAKPFGDVAADLYTIEFQKRGLPHCHTLLWVTHAYAVHDASQVDQYISATLPDITIDPVLHRIVTNFMLHGPCGFARLNAPCMKDKICTKKFPKPYEDVSRFDDAGYVHYKRPSTGVSFLKNGVPLDNGFVVPYNANLLLHFNAHINVEYCGWTMLIKYLFKYISKGADRVRFVLTQDTTQSDNQPKKNSQIVDEISNYLDGRFICPHEAMWRIFGFYIHHRNPPVQVLAVHLEGKQNLTFKQSQQLTDITSNPDTGKTTLTKWFVSNAKEMTNNETTSTSRSLRYIDYLTKYRWIISSKKWEVRKTKREPAIGRLAYVHPTCGELFYLRLLLTYQKGCCSYKDLRTVSGVVMPTFREACEALGLIENDKEWKTAITEAAIWASSVELRSLFTYMLLYCDVSNPRKLWDANWKCMSDDISRNINLTVSGASNFTNDSDLQQYVLHELQILLNSNSNPRTLTEFGLPEPDPTIFSALANTLLLEVKNYDRNALHLEHISLHASLHNEQLVVYDAVMNAVSTSTQLLAFVYGHGGTGKTYIWKTLISGLRSAGMIVLAVAASGIASLLLPAGRTAHSRFKIPLELTEESVCHIKKKTNLCQLLLETTLIIWDEAPMSDRRCFESLDKTLRDLTGNTMQFFGGKSVLLGGDFRKTLPVKPKCSKSEILTCCLPRSYLWKHFVVYTLSENLRITTNQSHISNKEELQAFSQWLLRIGDGNEGVVLDSEHPYIKKIEIPTQFLIRQSGNGLHD